MEWDDKILMSDILTTQATSSYIHCALHCMFQSQCLSFFHNKYSFHCQTHSLVFTNSTSLVSFNGTSYFYIIKGNSGQELIKSCDEPPTEKYVTWLPGFNIYGSRRHFRCSGSLLPTVDFVDCMTTGNWTLMSGYCRNIQTCEDVQTCSSTYGDGTYLLYPPVLGGHAVQIYCHNMTTDPKAYVTLFEENLSRHDRSLRTSSNPCQFLDRNSDASANFNRIRVNLTDMCVNRDDLTFATIYQELTSDIPSYGEAHACSFDYNNTNHLSIALLCPAPGFFTINTNGSGLIVDPKLTWTMVGFGTRLDHFERSTDGYIIRATMDGWCGSYLPSDTMHLQVDPMGELRGTASIPICPDL